MGTFPFAPFGAFGDTSLINEFLHVIKYYFL